VNLAAATTTGCLLALVLIIGASAPRPAQLAAPVPSRDLSGSATGAMAPGPSGAPSVSTVSSPPGSPRIGRRLASLPGPDARFGAPSLVPLPWKATARATAKAAGPSHGRPSARQTAQPSRPHAFSVGPQLRTGLASWYDAGPGFYAAMPGFVDGTRVVVVVTAFHDGRTFGVTVPIWTQCQCHVGTPAEVLVDLSPDAFRALGWPLSRGIAKVTIEITEGGLR